MKNNYFHPDHLGSSNVITEGSGYAYQLFLNLPFGETMAEQRRTGTFSNVFKFNGKELDTETGLYYYGARYYNPRVSNWLSVDPIALWQPVQETEHYILGQHNGGYFNPKNMSVYGYTYQNPIVYVDPNGKQNYSTKLNAEIGRIEHRTGLVVEGFKDNAKSAWDSTKQLAQDWYVANLSNSSIAKQELLDRRFAEANGTVAAIKDWENTKSQLADFASTPYGQGYLVGAVLFAVVEPNSPPLKGFKAINGAVEIAYTVRRLNKSLKLFVPSGFVKVNQTIKGQKNYYNKKEKIYITPDADMHKYNEGSVNPPKTPTV